MKYVKIERVGQPVWATVEGNRAFVMDGTAYGVWSYNGRKLPLLRTSFLPPCEGGKVVCVDAARNGGHADFSVWMGEGLSHHLAEISLAGEPRYEGMVALVIKQRAEKVKAAEAFNYILGVTGMAKLSGPEGERLPIGPVVSDEVDPFHLTLRIRRNGEEAVQCDTAAYMADICRILEEVTASVTLETGDVVAIGTDAVLSDVHPGEEIELELEGVGTLKNQMV